MAQAGRYELSSPDGELTAHVWTDEAGRPLWQLARRDTVVNAPSPLGLDELPDFGRPVAEVGGDSGSVKYAGI